MLLIDDAQEHPPTIECAVFTIKDSQLDVEGARERLQNIDSGPYQLIAVGRWLRFRDSVAYGSSLLRETGRSGS